MEMKVRFKDTLHSVLLDAADLPLFKSRKWRFMRTIHGNTYIVTSERRRTIYLHRLIMGCTEFRTQVDHINNDGLDNRRSNLRIATNSQNQANRQKRRGSRSSQYKGVSIKRSTGEIGAWIRLHRKGHFLGNFSTEQEAAMAYNVAARRAWGAFSVLNQVEMG